MKFLKRMLVMLMVIICISPANAISDNNTKVYEIDGIEVINYSYSLNEADIESIINASKVELHGENTDNIDLKVQYVIEDANKSIRFLSNNNVNNTYKATVIAKVVESNSTDKTVVDSNDLNNAKVNASMTLELVWTDGNNYNNKIKKVSGTLDVVKGTVKDGTVQWGDGFISAVNWDSRKVGAKKSWSYYPNKAVAKPAANYEVHFKGTTWSLFTSVYSSVFQ